jgi:hypothetical protein
LTVQRSTGDRNHRLRETEQASSDRRPLVPIQHLENDERARTRGRVDDFGGEQ